MNNYVMIGAGGTGTHLLHALTTYLRTIHAEGDWMLHIVDGDTVETKNLARQLFTPGSVTLNKAEAAARMMGDDGHIRAVPNYLSEENIQRIIQDGDTVFICADNFTVRKRIEEHCLTLENATIINGGNEQWSGSVQLWVREGGTNKTPRIGYMHPEVAIAIGEDRAAMTCAQAAALPGGDQTLVANMQSATWMMTALWRAVHRMWDLKRGQQPSPSTWTELQFDLKTGVVEHIDQRLSKHWNET